MKYSITILPKQEILYAEEGETLLDVLARAKYYLPASCGGKGTCGKCKVKLIEGKLENVTPDQEGYVLSCKAKIRGDLTVFLPTQTGAGLTDFSERTMQSEKTGLGVSLDVGTTTLAACLINLHTGETLRKISALNPQGVYGADVLSRIQACRDGKLALLQQLILNKTQEMLKMLSNGREIEELVVSANTTMLHLFLGVNPEPIGVYPFTPVFTQTQTVDGAALGLSVKKVRLLPSVSGYIGSDITAGILSCGMSQSEKTELLVDIGTNGEIVLSHKGNLYATSTAAGPALEGACIECGMGGVSGAIDKVYLQNEELCFTTIENQPPKGICGSGIIDFMSVLMQEQLIDENGTFNEETNSPLKKRLVDDKIYLMDAVYLSQQDIRQFQLAKAAISAGIETLLIECGVDKTQVETLYIAGGLGYFMNVENAAKTGLLPLAFSDKAKAVGNSSLSGARICLLNEQAQKNIEDIASETQIVELSFSKTFQDLYVENMYFEEL